MPACVTAMNQVIPRLALLSLCTWDAIVSATGVLLLTRLRHAFQLSAHGDPYVSPLGAPTSPRGVEDAQFQNTQVPETQADTCGEGEHDYDKSMKGPQYIQSFEEVVGAS